MSISQSEFDENIELKTFFKTIIKLRLDNSNNIINIGGFDYFPINIKRLKDILSIPEEKHNTKFSNIKIIVNNKEYIMNTKKTLYLFTIN